MGQPMVQHGFMVAALDLMDSAGSILILLIHANLDLNIREWCLRAIVISPEIAAVGLPKEESSRRQRTTVNRQLNKAGHNTLSRA